MSQKTFYAWGSWKSFFSESAANKRWRQGTEVMWSLLPELLQGHTAVVLVVQSELAVVFVFFLWLLTGTLSFHNLVGGISFFSGPQLENHPLNHLQWMETCIIAFSSQNLVEIPYNWMETQLMSLLFKIIHRPRCERFCVGDIFFLYHGRRRRKSTQWPWARVQEMAWWH